MRDSSVFLFFIISLGVLFGVFAIKILRFLSRLTKNATNSVKNKKRIEPTYNDNGQQPEEKVYIERRSGISISLAIFIAALGIYGYYFLSPYLALNSLIIAVESKNPDAFLQYFDMPLIKRNINHQIESIINNHITTMPGDSIISSFGDIMTNVVVSNIDHQLLSRNSLSNLVATEKVKETGSSRYFPIFGILKYCSYNTSNTFKFRTPGKRFYFTMTRVGLFDWKVTNIDINGFINGSIEKTEKSVTHSSTSQRKKWWDINYKGTSEKKPIKTMINGKNVFAFNAGSEDLGSNIKLRLIGDDSCNVKNYSCSSINQANVSVIILDGYKILRVEENVFKNGNRGYTAFSSKPGEAGKIVYWKNKNIYEKSLLFIDDSGGMQQGEQADYYDVIGIDDYKVKYYGSIRCNIFLVGEGGKGIKWCHLPTYASRDNFVNVIYQRPNGKQINIRYKLLKSSIVPVKNNEYTKLVSLFNID